VVATPNIGTGFFYKFTGKERDAESGLDYFIHRHYASTMGRFMQPDPAGMMAVWESS
jgi:RHS repeat-associated protein